MIEDTTALRDLARRLLAHEEADDRDPMRMVEATERACRTLYVQFGPVIGDTAFRAWAHRALRVTRAEYPFLTLDLALEQGGCLTGLRESLQERSTVQANEALIALLANFVAVFIALLGKNLLFAYLREAWPEMESP